MQYQMVAYHLGSMPNPVHEEVQKSFDKTFFKEKMRFDLAFLKAERQRIDADLKNAGYYNFNEEFLKFEADTNQYKEKKFDLYLGLKENVPEAGLVPYKVSKINVYENYDYKNKTEVR